MFKENYYTINGIINNAHLDNFVIVSKKLGNSAKFQWNQINNLLGKINIICTFPIQHQTMYMISINMIIQIIVNKQILTQLY